MHVVVIEIRPSKLCGINTLVAISPLLGNVIRSAIPLHAVIVARFKPMQSSISKQGYLIYVINHNKYCYGPDWRRCHFIYVCCRHSEPFVLTAFINRSEIYLNFSVESTFHSFFLTVLCFFPISSHFFSSSMLSDPLSPHKLKQFSRVCVYMEKPYFVSCKQCSCLRFTFHSTFDYHTG